MVGVLHQLLWRGGRGRLVGALHLLLCGRGGKGRMAQWSAAAAGIVLQVRDEIVELLDTDAVVGGRVLPQNLVELLRIRLDDAQQRVEFARLLLPDRGHASVKAAAADNAGPEADAAIDRPTVTPSRRSR